jgi:hypothetical protein
MLIAFLAINPEPDAFDLGLWTLDYQHGFIKRGMPGSVLDFFLNTPYQKDTLIAIFSCTHIITSILIFIFIKKQTDNITCIVIFSSGFLIQQLGYTTGKFDTLLIAIAIATLISLEKSASFLHLILTTALSALALLIHEGAALLTIPLIFSAFIIRSLYNNENILKPLVFLFITTIIFILVTIANKGSGISQSTLIEMGQRKLPELQTSNNAFRIFELSLKDNILWAISRLKDPATPSRFVLTLLAALPFIGILISFYMQLKEKIPALWIPIVITTGASASLYILGIDFSRWNAWIMTNTLFLIIFAARLTKTNVKTPKYLIISGILFLLWSGPFGVTVALPERGNFLHAIAGFIKLD